MFFAVIRHHSDRWLPRGFRTPPKKLLKFLAVIGDHWRSLMRAGDHAIFAAVLMRNCLLTEPHSPHIFTEEQPQTSGGNDERMGKHADKMSGADRAWGYRFGVDGLVSINDAMTILSIGRTKLYELLSEKKLRRGYIDKKPVICRRSVHEFLGTIEV